MSIEHIQQEMGEWGQKNFGEQPPHRMVKGALEELGEFIHSDLKVEQGIRLQEAGVGPEAEKDAIGDIIMYLCDYTYRAGLDMPEPSMTDAGPSYSTKDRCIMELSAALSELLKAEIQDHPSVFKSIQVQQAVNASYFLANAKGYDWHVCVVEAFSEVIGREWDAA